MEASIRLPSGVTRARPTRIATIAALVTIVAGWFAYVVVGADSDALALLIAVAGIIYLLAATASVAQVAQHRPSIGPSRAVALGVATVLQSGVGVLALASFGWAILLALPLTWLLLLPPHVEQDGRPLTG